MSDDELTSVEAELRRVRPGRAPEQFVDRLQHAVQRESGISNRSNENGAAHLDGFNQSSPVAALRKWLKRLAPIAGAAVLLFALFFMRNEPEPDTAKTVLDAEPQVIDEVELDNYLVAAFEGVATMPDGLPLRFRCYGWQQELTFRDASGAIEVEQRGPRLEVVPVGFDVY